MTRNPRIRRRGADHGQTRTFPGTFVCLPLLAAILPFATSEAVGQGVPDPPSTSVQQIPVEKPQPDMSETLRTSVEKLAVVAGDAPPTDEVAGDYEAATPGLIGGMNQGSRIGTVSQEIGGVNVNFPIPILTLPGAIIGGIHGASQREVQEFRDELTEELASAESKPLTNDGLALDVFQEIGRLSAPSARLFSPSAGIPGDTDAILYVRFNDITIDVQGSDAVLTVSALATLRDRKDGTELYEAVARYQDRDTLGNWTRDDNALWHDFANFAAHYLAREIAGAAFGHMETGYVLHPRETKSVRRDKKNERLFVSRDANPVLAWELVLPPEDPTGSKTVAIDESDVYYDVEIYDDRRLVYVARQVPDPSHEVAMYTDACGSLRWSVRPTYRLQDRVRHGEWMRYDTAGDSEPAIGITGRQASVAPAYTQDFPLLEMKCRRK